MNLVDGYITIIKFIQVYTAPNKQILQEVW